MFIPWIEAGMGIGPVTLNREDYDSVWCRDRLVKLSSLTSKQLRELKENRIPVTNFKIGLDLSVAEALTWGFRINQLNSSKHKASILRTAHGDIYTKDRKLRFGLAENDRCDRCGQPDSRIHAIGKCPKAIELWNTLRELDNRPRLTEDSPDLLHEIFGVSEPIGSELAVNAEVLQLLTNSLDKLVSTLPSRITLRIVLTKLYTLEKGRTRDNVKTLLDKLVADD